MSNLNLSFVVRVNSGITLELLPAIGEEYGISLRRARVVEKGRPDILGAGISLFSEDAKNKAISEAIERFALDHPVYGRSKAEYALLIEATGHYRKMDFSDDELIRLCSLQISGASCHVSLDLAVNTALKEVSEKLHLAEWSSYIQLGTNIWMATICLKSPLIIGRLAQFLSRYRRSYLVSACESSAVFPSLVCIAIDEALGRFYMASAASTQYVDALNIALLDIAKMFIFEDYSSKLGLPISFGHPLDKLPQYLNAKPVDVLDDLAFSQFLKSDSAEPVCGLVHQVPFLIDRACFIVSVRSEGTRRSTSFMHLFR